MKRALWTVVALAAFVLTGCGAIEDMIEDATKQTITVSRTIADDTDQRDVQSVTVAEDLHAKGGQIVPAGAVSVEDLAESIDACRLGLADVRFFVRGYFRNESNLPAYVTLHALPNNDADETPVTIGTLTLAPLEEREVMNPGEMSQGPDVIHEQLKALFLSLGEHRVINPVIQVQGANANGVTVGWIQLAALPVYWDTDTLAPKSLGDYNSNVKAIKDPALQGWVTNYGDNLAEVSIFLSRENEPVDPEADLIAHAFLAPGQTAHGFEMLTEDGAALIKSAFKQMIDGKTMAYDYVVASETPLKVKSSNLRIQIKLEVSADIF